MKKYNFYISIIIFFFCFTKSLAQDLCVSAPFYLEDSELTIYPENTRIYLYGIKEDSIDFNNPEEFLGSYLSANNQEWMNKHFEDSKSSVKLSEKKIQARKDFDPNLDFYKLIHHYSFTLNEVKHMIIKVIPYNKGIKKGKRVFHIYKKKDSYWVVNTKYSAFNYLVRLIRRIKTEQLFKVIQKNNFDDNIILTEAINSSFSYKNVFDFNKFYNLLNSWLTSNQMDKFYFFYEK